jgi:hypothetical protein
MATTETRTGFRLPWSSDHDHAPQPADESVEPVDAAEAVESVDQVIGDGTDEDWATGATQEDWPEIDVNARLRLPTQPEASDPTTVPPVAQEPAMFDIAAAQPPTPPAPRKPSKLMADLAAAIRATAESAGSQALAQLDQDVAGTVEAIHSGSKDGEAALRLRADDDVTAIREWSRAEIARIKEETETRIGARRVALEGELAAHGSAIEERVSGVQGTAAAYRSQMAAYAARLAQEDDPARLATMAELMPDPPALDAWADLDDPAPPAPPAVVPAVVPAPAAIATAVEPEPSAEMSPSAEPTAEAAVAPDVQEVEAAGQVVAAAAAQVVAEPEVVAASAAQVVAEPEVVVDPEAAAVAEPAPEPQAAHEAASTPWSDGGAAWSTGADNTTAPRNGAPADLPDPDAETAVPPDHGEMMTALEAEAAADAATRPFGGTLDSSFTDRLAALLPGRGTPTPEGEPQVTQVIVAGLVSVASIASFKRHLGRLPGISGVTVASGPDGDFVFNVSHGPDVSFRDVLPTMPGFAARVTSIGDGVVQVTARDPEAEG